MLQKEWLKAMRAVLQLAETSTNTFVSVPPDLLCVSIILHQATERQGAEIKKFGFANVDFSIADREEMAKAHIFYYKGRYSHYQSTSTNF